MKKTFALLLASMIGLTNCENQNSTKTNDKSNIDGTAKFDAKADAQKLNDLLKKYEEPSQTFKVSADKQIQIKGKQGTIIDINPTDLATENGQPLGKSIEVELKEISNQEQLLKTNAQTISNGQLLVSGGAYYINMTSEGQQLKLKEGKGLKVKFPKITNDKMSLFSGERDSLGKMAWKKTEQILNSQQQQPASVPAPTAKKSSNQSDPFDDVITYIKADTSASMTKEEKEKYQKEIKLQEVVYSSLDIKSFGWINCDYFLEEKNITDLFVKLNPSDSIQAAVLFLVFKDINSVMQSYYFEYEKNNISSTFHNIPIGYKVRLIAYSIKNEKIFSHSSDITVQNKQTLNLIMKETNQSDLAKLMGEKTKSGV